MRRHAVEALGVSGIAAVVTLVIAAPVVWAPSERIFGAEIVGRHHDPFTVMQQFAHPLTLGMYSQPVTDLPGAAIARVTGAVAAYNWLVLLTFPLSAAAAYLLARHLTLPPPGALVAALLFAFSPFHIAHAAYHPHIAQTQWLPLYLLALWRCLDAPTDPPEPRKWRSGKPLAVAFLIAATAAVTLSNFYGGLIAAVITPMAICVYGIARGARGLWVTFGTLAGFAAAGLAFVWWAAPAVIADPSAFAFEREDLFRHSAKWWGYLVPPVAHPLLGGFARRVWSAWSVKEGLLEHQVSLGWGVVSLGLVGIYAWLARDRRTPAVAAVPLLAVVAFTALVCSLSPERTVLGVTMTRPSALLYAIVPMFRAYARFGVIVQLMAALLAGVGVAWLLARPTGFSRAACAALVALAIWDYAVWPPALWRDVLPTAAHRWVVRQPDTARVLDCAPLTPESSSVTWLTNSRIRLLDGTTGDCGAPRLAARLLRAGFTHVLVRDARLRRRLDSRGRAEGLRVQARFADADVFAVVPQVLAP